jgi:hypothetical protein
MLLNKWNEKPMLERLLALTNEDASTKAKIISTLPEKMLDRYSGEEVKRELLLSESIERTGLVQTQIYGTVIHGANFVTCMKEACLNVSMQTDVMNVPYGSASGYATVVSEGAEVPNQYQDYSYKTLTAKKYAQKAPISEELIADAKFDLINIELEKLGKNLENARNRIMIDSMVANAGNAHDTNGTNQGLLAVLEAKVLCIDDGFSPDTFVMHPELYAKVFADYKPAYNVEAEKTFRSGDIPPILGMKGYVCGITATTGTNWDYDTNSDYGGLVFEKNAAAALGIRQDITVKYAEDPFKMLVSPIAYWRGDGSFINANAICKIQF